MPEVKLGGQYVYRAVVSCSLCNRTDNVGPFEHVQDALTKCLPDWCLISDYEPISFRTKDGRPLDVCPDCMSRPVREIRDAIRHLWG
jgi:hypothetical protein